MKHLVMIAGLVAVSGCSVLQGAGRLASFNNRQTFEGFYYPARVAVDPTAAEKFEIAVSRATQSLSGAKEAGRYAAVKYCLKQFGQTDITWSISPDMDDAALTIADDTLTLRGECKGWL
ncbi:MAG: hypothetical protein ACRBBU_11440 [Pseudooceanicola sp.]